MCSRVVIDYALACCELALGILGLYHTICLHSAFTRLLLIALCQVDVFMHIARHRPPHRLVCIGVKRLGNDVAAPATFVPFFTVGRRASLHIFLVSLGVVLIRRLLVRGLASGPCHQSEILRLVDRAHYRLLLLPLASAYRGCGRATSVLLQLSAVTRQLLGSFLLAMVLQLLVMLLLL